MLMTRASVWLLNPPPTRRKHARMRDGGCMHCAVVRPTKPLYETPCPYAYRRTEAIVLILVDWLSRLGRELKLACAGHVGGVG